MLILKMTIWILILFKLKLDMASLCIEMGDIESAQAILEEIIGEADKQGKAKAREILNSIET